MEEQQKTARIFGLITDILKARPRENIHIQQFHSLVRSELKDFFNKAAEVNQMDAIDEFEKIENEMNLIANCPVVHSKMVGAIGGGFSSGKSTFINSFMLDDGVRLATGVVPVTAIPSYVICGDSSDISGISYRGGSFKIEADMYKDISHELLKKLDFDLKEILRYITVTAKLDDEYFSNICLIDTPGYNAPSVGTTEQDKTIARDYIKDAKFLIWIIGLGSTGTFPKNDLDFLNNPDLFFGKNEAKSLYIVANKARSITPSNRPKILEQLKEVLDDYGIRYEGISIYDSEKKEEYLYDGISVKEFLKKQNVATQKYVELALPLKKIFTRYENEIRKKYDSDKEYQRKIQKLILDGMETQVINITSGAKSLLEDGLNELKNYLKPGDLNQTLKTINDIQKDFFDCIDLFCDEIGIQKIEVPALNTATEIRQEDEDEDKPEIKIPAKKKFCDRCGTKLSESDNFCPKCGTTTLSGDEYE